MSHEMDIVDAISKLALSIFNLPFVLLIIVLVLKKPFFEYLQETSINSKKVHDIQNKSKEFSNYIMKNVVGDLIKQTEKTSSSIIDNVNKDVFDLLVGKGWE
jgi:hypothetical protein